MDRSILSVNDLHVGVKRVAGTTPLTMYKLRKDLLKAVQGLVMEHTDKHLHVNGDALDGAAVDMSDLLALIRIFGEWLDASAVVQQGADGRYSSPAEAQPRLTLARGNHDIVKDSSQLSAFDFIGEILKAQYPGRVRVITEPALIYPGHYVIPHMPNQDLFDLALKYAWEEADDITGGRPCYLHLHANYDNDFAVEADHSLNVSEEQAQALIKVGYHLVFGHEHQQATYTGITIVGNQFPTSIADCLGNDYKRALIFHPTPIGWSMEEVRTWEAEGSFVEIDWKLVNDTPPGTDFVRVVGTAPKEDAAKVLQVVQKFRQAADCYVVSASVKYDGTDEEMAQLDVAASELKAVDVLEYLYDHLDEKQKETVKRLLGRRGEVDVAA